MDLSAEIINRFGAGLPNYLVDDLMVKRLHSAGNRLLTVG
jgi:hypothetical protein